MGKYLKMADVFDCEVDNDADLMFSDSLGNIADFSGYKTQCRYAAHAINSHDELVAEVNRLNLQIEDLLRCVDLAVMSGDISPIYAARKKYITD